MGNSNGELITAIATVIVGILNAIGSDQGGK